MANESASHDRGIANRLVAAANSIRVRADNSNMEDYMLAWADIMDEAARTIRSERGPSFPKVSLDLWNEICEFLEDHMDVKDGSYGEPHPNRAMSIITRIQAEVNTRPAERNGEA